MFKLCAILPWFSTTNVYTPAVKVDVDKVIAYSVSLAVTLVPVTDGVAASGLLAGVPPPPHPANTSASPATAANVMNLRANSPTAAPIGVRYDDLPANRLVTQRARCDVSC